MKQLMVCSNSTKKFAEEWEWNTIYHVYSHPTKKVLEWKDTEENVIAIGGGSVIDTAKIISRNPIIAIPTTLAGASQTTHAVYWERTKKKNILTKKAKVILFPKYLRSLPREKLKYTKIDCTCHALEALISKKGNIISKFLANTALDLLRKNELEDWLNASLLAGDAMEITGTNIIHALSYPLTISYGIPHGKALAYFLPKVLSHYSLERKVQDNVKVELEINLEKVIEEALTYPKVFETNKPIDKAILKKMLS